MASSQLFNTLSDDREIQILCFLLCGISSVDQVRCTFEECEKALSLARDVEKQSATFSDDLMDG